MQHSPEARGGHGCGDVHLGMDKACLAVINTDYRDVHVYGQTSECYVCDGLLLGNISANSSAAFAVDTVYPYHVYYTVDTHNCHTTHSFREHGHYGWNLTHESCSYIYTTNDPPNPYMPIFAAFMLFLFISAIGTLFVRSGMISRLLRKEKPDIESVGIDDSDLEKLQKTEAELELDERVTKSSTRARFLDTFRGIAVLLMIFVNSGGGKYWFFNHSAWNGLTVADLCLPFFAWIMGFSIVISMRAKFEVPVSRSSIILRSLRRSLTLILLGLIVNSLTAGYITPNELRFTGVLQLLGISYFICSTVEAIFTKAEPTSQYGWFGFLQDILDSWAQWLVILAITTIHLLLTFLLPVPNCPTGYLGPGGYDGYGEFANCTAGAAGHIDRFILGNHIYGNKVNAVYGMHAAYDPEGIMNTMAAVFLVYMGVQAGRIMLTYHQANARVFRWISWSLVTGIIAGILCNFGKEDGIIPINKSIMSLSYVLATSSIAFFVNAVLYVLIDCKNWWNGSPFHYAGTNAIVLYMGHYVTMGIFPWVWKIAGPHTHANILAMNLWTTTLWAVTAYILYKKDIIVIV